MKNPDLQAVDKEISEQSIKSMKKYYIDKCIRHFVSLVFFISLGIFLAAKGIPILPIFSIACGFFDLAEFLVNLVSYRAETSKEENRKS